MPDEDKTTNTNQPTTGDTSLPVSSPTTTPLDISGQMNDAPPPPPMEDGAFSPPPPIVEETKTEEVFAPSQTPETNGNTQDIPDIPPVITTSGTGGKKPVGKKMIATILGVLVLVGGLGAGVILVQNQQDIREKAADIPATPEYKSLVPCTKNADCGYANVCDIFTGKCGVDKDFKIPVTCQEAGGVCKTTPLCARLGLTTVNSGNGCSNVDQICCSTTTWNEPIPIQTSIPEKACVKEGGSCNSTLRCCTNLECSNGKCVKKETPSEPLGCNEITPKTHTGDYGYCNWPVNNEKIDGKSFCYSGATCPQSTPSCTGDAVVGAGGVIGGAQYCEVDGSTTTVTKTNISSSINCACLNIKAYDGDWAAITNLSSLVAGDIVRFTVSGTTNSGAIDKARFTINGTSRPEVTAKKPGTNEFYDEYTIPEGVTSFTINAELHHTALDWF